MSEILLKLGSIVLSQILITKFWDLKMLRLNYVVCNFSFTNVEIVEFFYQDFISCSIFSVPCCQIMKYCFFIGYLQN